MFGEQGKRIKGRAPWWSKHGARQHQEATCWTETCKYETSRPHSVEEFVDQAREQAWPDHARFGASTKRFGKQISETANAQMVGRSRHPGWERNDQAPIFGRQKRAGATSWWRKHGARETQ